MRPSYGAQGVHAHEAIKLLLARVASITISLTLFRLFRSMAFRWCGGHRGDAAAIHRGRIDPAARPALFTVDVLVVSVLVAGKYGLVALIAKGYGWLAVAFLLIYVLPLLTLGAWRLALGSISSGPSTERRTLTRTE